MSVFQSKCVLCHGQDVKKPPLGFGYVLDLKRLAADKERLEALGALVASGNMPTPQSKTGPLSDAQKATVKAWIAAGAPEAKTDVTSVLPNQPVPAGAGQPPQDGAATSQQPEPAYFLRTIEWVGKFHLLVLHFPIALIFVAAMCEGWLWWQGLGYERVSFGPMATVRFCVVLAALFAMPTAIFGWLHALSGSGASQPTTLLLHRWVGTLAFVMLAATAVLDEYDWRTFKRTVPTRAMIFLSALVIGVTGHFGGMLVHGPSFLDW